ncbi:hypothetical protein Drose_05755 [Dactylosporangium roseum]|uniref:Uncharacterized protein n=1 Tax=Dactylosporangium roseum TaxID=47989 RepID=A0ABY5Z6V5_9ACTN|nr:hypothetical protein [Dactylosporangium roseum]UWZ37775.1 hypothetical protein Drose_05755 [Dactylosporangium roseum]
MSSGTYLSGFAGLLRRWADRISPETAPRGPVASFTFEHEEGIRFRDDGRGCPLWYLGDADYERAHTEANTRHVRVDWRSMTVTHPGGER